jgi:hypothetical protein
LLTLIVALMMPGGTVKNGILWELLPIASLLRVLRGHLLSAWQQS